MAEKLLHAFEIAKNELGVHAQFKLALRTGLSMVTAAETEDNEDNIRLMEEALKDILGKEVQL